MKILIETIPYSEQRYPTVGDWQWLNAAKAEEVLKDAWSSLDESTLHIKVSELSDWRYEALISIHEAIEALLCKHTGVTEAQVDEFDTRWEAARKIRHVDGEPGNSPDAPYHKQHIMAERVEWTLSQWLEVDWAAYSKEVNSL